MWNYEKRLEYPVNIKQTDPKMAQYIMSQYGGPDGEISASLRYLSQRYSIPYREVANVLTDIGTEEIAHTCWIWQLIKSVPDSGTLLIKGRYNNLRFYCY